MSPPGHLAKLTWNWQLAATPSYNGVVTSKMHADTFGILKGSKNPDAAFEVLTYMLSPEVAPKLLNIYGGMPARLSLQGDYFATYGETNFPGKDINWDVVVDSMAYADNPNHEATCPASRKPPIATMNTGTCWPTPPALTLKPKQQNSC
jgi:multiple sugar transport system substrate-binding protein